jgi:pyruvate formate lyase activating enzyme
MNTGDAVRDEIEPGVVRGEWWHRLEDGRFQCDLCPRFCKLHEGQKAFCFVREARDSEIVLTSYGRATSYCIDPIEKKPLNHFYPGSSVLSFGTAGCNLGCRFCQNWDISKAREERILSSTASPRAVAEAAAEAACTSIAFTYNDPIIFAEYAIDCAKAAQARGIKTVAVSSGYITPEARRDFYAHIDAANVDLKAFTETFYHEIAFAHLAPVLETLRWLKHETAVWLEVTTLLIPGHNDSVEEVEQLCSWFAENLGPEVPLHFSAFHPDFKMTDVASTPAATLSRARDQARRAGLQHVYTGNIRDVDGQSSYCRQCEQRVIGRDRYDITAWHLDAAGRCDACGSVLAGRFDPEPGQWGMKRQPVFFRPNVRR